MRFANQSPKRLLNDATSSALGPPAPVTVFARADLPLFVTTSSTSICLWNMKPQVMLARVTRTKDMIATQGDIVGAVWKSNSAAVVCWTSKGYLLFFGISSSKNLERVLEFDFRREFYYMPGPGEGKGIPPFQITPLQVLSTGKEILTVFAVGLNIFVSSKDGTIDTRTWDGSLVRSIPLQQLPFLGENVPADLCITTAATLAAPGAACILSDGRAFLLLPADSGLKWTGYPCEYAPAQGSQKPPLATAVSFNGKYGYIAVGLDDGSVKIFAMNESRENLVQINHFSLRHVKEYAQVASSVREVTALDWTLDGLNLAVGWGNSGFAVWDMLGRLTSCSITDIDSLSSEHVPERSGSFDQGIISLFWGSDGYELFVLSRAQDAGQTILSVQPFLRTSTSMNHTQDNFRHPAILGENVIHLYVGQMTGVEISSPEVQYWRQIQLPPNYLTENWPISNLSCGGNGSYIAVAGRRGICHYNVNTNKWKLFNNVQEEREFRCRGGMVWIGEVLVVACQDDTTLTHGLRFFLQGSRLDKQHMLHSKDLPAAVVHLEALGDFLLAFTSDGIVREYKLDIIMEGVDPITSLPVASSLKLTLIRDTKLQGQLHPLSVRAVTWLAGKSHNPKNFPNNLPLVVLEAGSLFVVDRSDSQTPKLSLVSKNVEQFFVAPLSDKLSSLATTLWIVDPDGVLVWLKDALHSTKTELNGNSEHTPVPSPPPLTSVVDPKEFTTHRISLGFYPLTVLVNEGFLMGVSHVTHRRSFFDTPVVSFKTQNENHLFLPNILGHLLRKGDVRDATVFGKTYKEYLYFGHSLEVLLHEAVEDQKDTPSGVAALQKTIQFIEQFPQFLDVVMSVARKTEADSWPYFFTFAGDPQELFEMSLETGRLRTACSYLSIIHNMEEKAVSRKAASRLLETSLYTEEFEIAQEIVEFLRKLDAFAGNGIENGSQLYLETLLSRHARLLLQNCRIRALGEFSRKLGFPLAQWLPRESHRAAVVSDVAGAFEALHQQFNWPYPANVQVLDEIFKRVSTKPATTFQISPQKSREEEMWSLLQLMIQSRCLDWIVLLGYMVGYVDGPADVFRGDPNRHDEFSKVIQDKKCAGYQEFSKRVEAQMASRK